MAYTPQDHTFAVCAYKENPYLEECVASLVNQTIKANIIICTATPNDHISSIAHKYQLPIYINTGRADISGAWNFAFSTVTTPLLTIVHQDDVYEPDYLKETLQQMNQFQQPLICFTDYYELRNGEKVFKDGNKNLKIKEFLLSPLRIRAMQKSKWMRRRILSLSDPICCPAVTYHKKLLDGFMFDGEYSTALDWDAWERISRLKGDFCYVHKPLMGHRIHAESITSDTIENNVRNEEEMEMFKRFWPTPIAKCIASAYKSAQKQNQL